MSAVESDTAHLKQIGFMVVSAVRRCKHSDAEGEGGGESEHALLKFAIAP